MEHDRPFAETIPDGTYAELADAAWEARENARVIGPTKVGVAVLSTGGDVHVGCNVEHRFRAHDIHGEVNALSTMVASGPWKARAVVIAAERESFTPCGGCMDWIFQTGDPETVVAFQGSRGGEIVRYTARELMPHYPR